MTHLVPRTTSNLLAWLALCLAATLLVACGAPAAVSTPLSTAVNTAVPPSATVQPSATRTTSPVPATDTRVPPTATARPSQTPRATSTAAASATEAASATNTVVPAASPVGSGDFTPAQASIWNSALVGGDNTTGTCTATANAPYGPMQLTPGAGTLALHNTVPEDYVLTRLAPNTYQYSGPAFLGDGNIMLDLRFTSATELVMTRTFVSNAEPGCTHQHNYTGTFRNNR